jgi:hypothetical protein
LKIGLVLLNLVVLANFRWVFTGYSSSQILTNPISTIGGVGGSEGTFKSNLLSTKTAVF